MADILLPAYAASALLAAMLGPLGAFVVWRRMAYFGDTIAHASLLGVALALMFDGLPIVVAVFLVAAAVAWVLAHYTRDKRFAADTLLGILSHSALALGLVLLALNREPVDVNAYLFGDVLTAGPEGISTLALLSVFVLGMLFAHWRKWLMMTLSPDIARVEGINTAREQLWLTLTLAAVIALSIKLTGILLITALLIIPAAAARYLAKSPLHMALLASVLGIMGTSTGLYASLKLDVPSAPMMVVMASAIFLLAALFSRVKA